MKYKWFTVLAVVAGLMSFAPVYADSAVLTKERVETFFEESTGAQMEGLKPTIDFLKKHVHEDSQSIIHVISNMAGAPQQKQTLELDKTGLLRETHKGYEAGTLESIENNILTLDIDKNGRSASVKDSTYSVFTMLMNGPVGIMTFKAEQSSLCDTEIELGEDNIIYVKNSVCNTEANITPQK